MATKYSLAFKNIKMLKMLKLPNLSLLNIQPRYGQKPFCLVIWCFKFTLLVHHNYSLSVQFSDNNIFYFQVPPGLEPVQPRLDSSVLQPLESRSSLLMNSPAATVSTLESVKLSLSRASETSSASNSLKKPKKGQSTAKQRLGKILKLKFWA